MKKNKVYFLLFTLMIISCEKELLPFSSQSINIIPKPVVIEKVRGEFIFTSETTFEFDIDSAELTNIAYLFNEKIKVPFGFEIKKGESNNKISLIIDETLTVNSEAYFINIEPNNITIKAPSAKGIFYGMQTIYQLLPPSAKSLKHVDSVKWSVPAVKIEDYPRMKWRGMMLDVTRHFFTKEEVLKVIDQLSEYKINRLHLHLTDDQGWRIEIKSMPKLVEKASMRPSRIGDWWKLDAPKANEPFDYGGFYTQDDMKEIIKYASDRYIEIIPEIDVPGHSLALMVAYPKLHCNKTLKFVNIGNKQSWHKSSLCIGNEDLIPTMKVIFGEIAALFPSQYIHIGGDEASKREWKRCPKCQKLMRQKGIKDVDGLQSYFIKELDKYISSLDKKMIGWDEILDGGLSPNAIVMSWRGMKGGKKATNSGHSVIMTPNTNCYLDLYKGDPIVEPETYGECRFRDNYEWDPVPEGVDEALILGGQGNIWSERVTTARYLEYCIYPSMWALSETFWSQQENREWSDFFKRAEEHFIRADFADINYSKSVFNVWVRSYVSKKDRKVYVEFDRELDDLDVYYTLDNTMPDHHSIKYDGIPFVMKGNSSKIKIQTYRNGKPCGKFFIITRDEVNKRARGIFK